MKIAHLNNIANNALNYVLALRQQGIDAHLFFEEGSHKFSQPDWEIPGIKEQSWIHETRSLSGPIWLIAARALRLVFELSKFDVISAWDVGPIWAQWSRKPLLVHSAGGDLLTALRASTFRERLLRRGYEHSYCLIYYMPYQEKLLNKLKIRQKIFGRLPINEKRYCPNKRSEKFKYLDQYETVFFCPSRQDWKWKGSHMLIKAYSKVVKQEVDTHLVMVKWGMDLIKSLELCKHLNIENKISWLPPLNKPNLINMYRSCDVVVDQFVLGSYGATSIEALMCGKPVIIKVNGYERYYKEELPFVNVQNQKEIVNAMVMLSQDRKLRKKIGEFSRKWAIKYHSYESVSTEYLNLVSNLVHNVD
jgi:glycosyltransferase involved in cell wall biosynthesis